jgi:hypothetical protein
MVINMSITQTQTTSMIDYMNAGPLILNVVLMLVLKDLGKTLRNQKKCSISYTERLL